MRPCYRLTEDALADLDEIAAYIAGESGLERAERVLARFEEAFAALAGAPGMGHRRPDAPRRFRVWAVFSYLVFYDPDTEPLTVARILHGARDVEAVFTTMLGED